MQVPAKLTMALILIFSLGNCCHANDKYKMEVVPSWGDMVCVWADGVDPAMDSPQAIENMIKHWKGRGFSGVHLRTDLQQFEPYVRRNPLKEHESPTLAMLWKHVDDVMEKFNVHVVMQQMADKHDFKYWAWHPHLYSDGALNTPAVPARAGCGHGRM